MTKKIRFALSACLLLAVHTITAQNDATYLHAGLNLSTVRAAFTSVDFNKLNIIVGAGVTMGTDDEHFFYGFEANLAQKGNRTVNPTPGAQIEQTRANLFYLQVPGYAGYRFDEHWAMFLGPAVGVLLYNSEENLFSINQNPTPFTTFELSLLAGVKYDFGEHFGVMLRLEHSIISILSVAPELRQIRGARRFHALAGFSFYYTIQ